VKAGPTLRRRRDDALIAAVLAALTLALTLSDVAWRADRLLYDASLAWWTRPAPPDIVIVAIDDASIDAIGRWPWPRTVHATVLAQLAQAQPKAIALDLVLSEPEPEGDRWLADALQQAAPQVPVVMPVAWQVLDGQLKVLAPNTVLRRQVTLGASEPAVDADGVLRHLFLHAGPPDAMLPHLALALLLAGGDALHPGLSPEPGPAPDAASDAWRRDGRLLMRFSGPPGNVPRVSYVDVLQGRVPAQALAGRYLLVGMTAQGLGDTLATPVNASHRAMPGVEVLANATALLRDGGGLRVVPPTLVGALSALALMGLVFAFRRLGDRRALPLALATVPVAALASVGSLGLGWVWSPVAYVVPALLAYPLWSWRRLQHTVYLLDREIQALAAERADGSLTAADAQPLDDGSDPLARRLHELATTGQQLRDARRFLAGTLDQLPTAMLVGDAHDHVALANAQAATLFEVDQAADLRGLDLPRLVAEFAPKTALDWPAELAALRPGTAGLSVEARLGRHDLLLHVGSVDLQGQRRLIVSAADLATVREAQRLREETLAFVSHDLRGPASSMMLLTDLHLQGKSPLGTEALVREMQRLAQRTLALADDFVHAARAQTRPLDLTPVVPADLLAEGVADLRARALEAAVDLSVQAHGDRPVRLDRQLASRALANLVSNALKHAPRGSAVQVHAWRDHAGLRVDVIDAGPGMAPDQRAALVRGEEALRVAGPGGVGLGLLFVRRVARRHGGSLTAGPGPAGVGERFSLRLAEQSSGNP
jgi:CHASE2 domain-containing sensor protein